MDTFYILGLTYVIGFFLTFLLYLINENNNYHSIDLGDGFIAVLASIIWPLVAFISFFVWIVRKLGNR
jgi:magnesium-transporting ATPase (P-type)